MPVSPSVQNLQRRKSRERRPGILLHIPAFPNFLSPRLTPAVSPETPDAFMRPVIVYAKWEDASD